MNIYKKRKRKYIIFLSVIFFLLILAIILRYKGYPPLKLISNKITASTIKGNAFFIKDNKKQKLNLNDTFIIDKNSKVILSNKSKIWLKFNNGSRIRWVYWNGTLALKEINKIINGLTESERENYSQKKKEFNNNNKYIIIILIVFIPWILFSYYKKMGLHIAFFGLMPSLFLILIISQEILSLLSNFGVVFLSWLFFDKSPMIPEEEKIKSDATNLILEGYELYKKKDYSNALMKFKSAVRIDPQRFDAAKMVRVLETKIDNPEKLPFLINLKNKILNK